MKTEWIECFLAVASTGSVNKAAEVLYQTQPNVTKMIQALEKNLEAELFQRKRTGLELTEQGELFLPYAMEMMKTYRAYEKERATLLEQEQSQAVELLEIACSSLLFQAYHREISASLRSSFPNIPVKYVEIGMKNLISLVQENPHMVGFLGVPDYQLASLPEDLVFRKIHETPIVACVNSAAGYRQGEVVSRNQLPERVITVNYYSWDDHSRDTDFGISTGSLDVINDMLLFNTDIFSYMPEDVARKALDPVHINILQSDDDINLITGILHQKDMGDVLPEWFLNRLETTLKKALK